MSTTSPLAFRTAQTLGLTTSLLLAGSNFAISTILVPALLHSPANLLLKQWNVAYQTGKAMARPLALLSALSYAYLAYGAHTGGDKSKLLRYASAAVLAIGIVPYTMIVMGSTNGQLLERVDSTRTLGKEEELTELGLPKGKSAHELVDWWGVLCLGRATISLAAGVLGTWTALS